MDNTEVTPTSPKKRRTGCWIAAIILGVFFLLCVLVGGVALIGVALLDLAEGVQDVDLDTASLTERTIEGQGLAKILVVRVRGIISDEPQERFPFRRPSLLHSVTKQLEKAESDTRIRALLLAIDSPGGGITASDILHRKITEFKRRTGHKIVVCMGDLAASGGYYISAPADHIVAHATTITGSIGVIMPLMDFSELTNRIGIRSTSIKSGPMKDIGSPMRTMTPEEAKSLNAIVQEMHTRFVQIIAKGRKMSDVQARKLADGRIYTGVQAKQLGLVDQVGYFEDAVAAAKRLCDLEDATLIEYRRPTSFVDMLYATLGGISAERKIKLDFCPTDAHRNVLPAYLWRPASLTM